MTHNISYWLETNIYSAWQKMRHTCTYNRYPGYDKVGALGITYPPEWDDFKTFLDWSVSNGAEPFNNFKRYDESANFSQTNSYWEVR